MKKVISGKLYDTETAEKICSSGLVKGDSMVDNHEVHLYRTSKGAFFKVYSGYEWHGEDADYETHMSVISEDEAKEIFEEYDGNPETYTLFFGEPQEA